jgi:replication-associated recombination protein RarA
MNNLDRLKAQFDVMEGLVERVASGNIRGLIISGPAGIGKTFNVVSALKSYRDNVAPLIGVTAEINICTGHMTPVGLVEALWNNRHSSNTLVLDDIDTVFDKLDSLNILKAALDSGAERTISYMTQNQTLKKAGVPKQFVYEGSVILITNQDMENCHSKLAPHFKALISRCYYFDLGFTGQEDCFAWIKHVCRTKHVLGNEHVTNDVLGYMDEHLSELRELSLRTALKIKAVHNQANWRQVSDFTVLAQM